MFKQLAILYTKKCNACCDICCFGCSPNDNEKMSINDAKHYISEASKLKTISRVGFSGGEALLYIDEICELAKYAKTLNLGSTVTSNGFWGTTLDKAKSIIEKLLESGFVKLGLSVDEFHQKFVPIQNIKNILTVARGYNFQVDIGFLVTRNSKRISDILPELGDSVLDCVLMEYPCLPVGNALKYSKNCIRRKLLTNEICTEMNILAVYPDGSVYPCCSQAGFTEALYLGNLKSDTIERIIKNFNSNMYCRILRKYGFKWFTDIIINENLDIELNPEYVSKCELCYNLFSDSSKRSLFDKYIEFEKQEIYQRYLQISR